MERREFGAKKTGTCPFCQTVVCFEIVSGGVHTCNGDTFRYESVSGIALSVLQSRKGERHLSASTCPHCKNIILVDSTGTLLWPDTCNLTIPEVVKSEAPGLAADFDEAALVLQKSPRASAALSRRCLQTILVDKGGAKKSDNLADQIQEVLHSLPHELALNLGVVRQIGNFVAHPMKSTNSGEILDVEEGEAEWSLQIIEELFDHYYVLPSRSAARRKELDDKLKAAGKQGLERT